jgi:hypothetical protein
MYTLCGRGIVPREGIGAIFPYKLNVQQSPAECTEAIAACLVFLRETCHPTFAEFCNKIGTNAK